MLILLVSLNYRTSCSVINTVHVFTDLIKHRDWYVLEHGDFLKKSRKIFPSLLSKRHNVLFVAVGRNLCNKCILINHELVLSELIESILAAVVLLGVLEVWTVHKKAVVRD